MPQRTAKKLIREKIERMPLSRFLHEYKEIAGYGTPSRAIYQTIRELVENALDATDVYGIKPDIVLVIEEIGKEKYRIRITDNGIGVDPKYVPNAFASVLSSSKYKFRQSRGRFGLGVKMAVFHAQSTTGEATEVYTSPIGSSKIYYFSLKPNISLTELEEKEPIILAKGVWSKPSNWHGTVVRLIIRGAWSRVRSRIKEYLKMTAIVTPYARIIVITPDGEIIVYPRIVEEVPPGPKETKPHPHGVDIEMLKYLIRKSSARTLKEFLIEAFQGVGRKTAEKVIKEAGLDPNIDPRKMDDKMLEKLAVTLRNYKGFRSPSAAALSPIGANIIKAGLRTIFSPEFVEAVTRKPKAYQGHPFIVEVGIAYGGAIPAMDEPLLLRYANKIPLLLEKSGDVAAKVVKSINWRQYLVSFPAPLVILTHICSTKIPYTGLGKESVMDVDEIRDELEAAIREVARKLRAYLLEKRREQETKRRLITFLKYMPEITKSLLVVAKNTKVKEEEIRDKLIECITRKLGVPKEHVVKMISNYDVKIEE